MNEENIKYGVFIIESMDSENESKGKLDGYVLKLMLDLCDIPNQYYYLRTKIELENIILEFEKSEFQFLHISCHGSESKLFLTYESLTFEELGNMLGYYLYAKRLFLSACKLAIFEFAEQFIPKYNCYSVVGTPTNIDYDKAAIFWSSFYYLMYSTNEERMIQGEILQALINASKLFDMTLNYFSIINEHNKISVDHLREILICNGEKSNDAIRLTSFKNQYREENYPFYLQSYDDYHGS